MPEYIIDHHLFPFFPDPATNLVDHNHVGTLHLICQQRANAPLVSLLCAQDGAVHEPPAVPRRDWAGEQLMIGRAWVIVLQAPNLDLVVDLVGLCGFIMVDSLESGSTWIISAWIQASFTPAWSILDG